MSLFRTKETSLLSLCTQSARKCWHVLQHSGKIKKVYRNSFVDSISQYGVFGRQILTAPKSVGAVCPSGAALSKTMANMLRKQCVRDGDIVVELGPGTGSVTRALLDSGFPRHNLYLIERAPEFCKLLKKRFPGVVVIQGDASCIERYLPEGRRVAAIVSSLPLVSLPAQVRSAIMTSMAQTLDAQGCIIQYTYAFWKATPLRSKGFTVKARKNVLCNIPPARVEMLCKR